MYYPKGYAKNVQSINYDALYKMGYRGILFDIDNTLVHHGDDSTEEIDELFRKIHRIGFKTLLLTNNDEPRVKRFIKNIDTLYICEADKPDPKNYLVGVEKMGLQKEEVITIGDQVFTDILGSNRSGIDGILVHFIKLPSEKRIGKKRYIEKGIVFLSKFQKNRLKDITL